MGAHQDGDLFKDLADAAFRKPVPAREATRLLALMFALAGVVVASQDQSSSRFIVLIFSALGIVVWFVAWRTDPKRVPVKSGQALLKVTFFIVSFLPLIGIVFIMAGEPTIGIYSIAVSIPLVIAVRIRLSGVLKRKKEVLDELIN